MRIQKTIWQNEENSQQYLQRSLALIPEKRPSCPRCHVDYTKSFLGEQTLVTSHPKSEKRRKSYYRGRGENKLTQGIISRQRVSLST